jgi:beta-glucosidase
MRLPGVQIDYLRRLSATGAKIVLVLSGGSPISLEGIEDLVDAILFVGYPGQEGGKAVADILFGDVNPSGHLPITFPKSEDQIPPFEDYSMSNRTYRYSKEEPLFPFGFGLSYTDYQYTGLKLDRTNVPAGEDLKIEATLRNCGDRAGEQVVQVYLSDREATVPVPQHKLVDFCRVALVPGESKLVEFRIPAEKMAFVDEDGHAKLEAGAFEIELGSCSPGERGQVLGAPQPLRAEFWVK